ncbi:hypothetical protein QR680_018700 [Steinernema hermaphroditum]|uniref:Uncharacterized protein n=1 Tax=Steinernema hermaphroditum TaxID=289476 RepID=A0AA39HKW5_9BILA|nr:hypothetical protein QR680_018700 [Steinernema hermaphroditum]
MRHFVQGVFFLTFTGNAQWECVDSYLRKYGVGKRGFCHKPQHHPTSSALRLSTKSFGYPFLLCQLSANKVLYLALYFYLLFAVVLSISSLLQLLIAVLSRPCRVSFYERFLMENPPKRRYRKNSVSVSKFIDARIGVDGYYIMRLLDSMASRRFAAIVLHRCALSMDQMTPDLTEGIITRTLTFADSRQNWRRGVEATYTTLWETQSEGGRLYDYVETRNIKMTPRAKETIQVIRKTKRTTPNRQYPISAGHAGYFRSGGPPPFMCRVIPPMDPPVFVPDCPLITRRPEEGVTSTEFHPGLSNVEGTMRQIAESKRELKEFLGSLPNPIDKEFLRTLKGTRFYKDALIKYKEQQDVTRARGKFHEVNGLPGEQQGDCRSNSNFKTYQGSRNDCQDNCAILFTKTVKLTEAMNSGDHGRDKE